MATTIRFRLPDGSEKSVSFKDSIFPVVIEIDCDEGEGFPATPLRIEYTDCGLAFDGVTLCEAPNTEFGVRIIDQASVLSPQ